MRKKLLVLLWTIFVTFGVSGCGLFVSEDKVVKATEKQGYRDVRVTSGHIFFVDWRGCGKDDDAAFKATGINPIGERVDLVICVGWPFKGVTVRTQ